MIEWIQIRQSLSDISSRSFPLEWNLLRSPPLLFALSVDQWHRSSATLQSPSNRIWGFSSQYLLLYERLHFVAGFENEMIKQRKAINSNSFIVYRIFLTCQGWKSFFFIAHQYSSILLCFVLDRLARSISVLRLLALIVILLIPMTELNWIGNQTKNKFQNNLG